MILTRCSILMASLLQTVPPLPRSSASAPKGEPVMKLLPRATFSADVVEPGMSPDNTRIMKRFQASVTSRQTWFLRYVRDHANERPLPYHENFGVSSAEYDQFLAASKSMPLLKLGERRVSVMSVRAGVLSYRGEGLELDVDIATGEAQLGGRPLGQPEYFVPEQKSPIGVVYGYRWKWRSPGLNSAVLGRAETLLQTAAGDDLRIDVARLDDGRCFLSVDLRTFVPGKPRVRDGVSLRYRCSGSAASSPADASRPERRGK